MTNPKLIDIFLSLVKIPSPSMKEEDVADKIIELLSGNGIQASKDHFGNVIAKIPPTNQNRKPILLSAHMDVVGDDSAVCPVISEGFISTNEVRTLGADDKAGIAASILLAIEINNDKTICHGGLELVFTKDEEQGMSGVKHLDKASLDSEYILVLDASSLGEILVSGASYTKLILSVKTLYGGHSGIDIADTNRLNAVKLIAQAISKIPQGVYANDHLGVVTSINAGSVIGGGLEPILKDLCNSKLKSENFCKHLADTSLTNIINTTAYASYSIRSSDPQNETRLISEIKNIISTFNERYKNLAVFEIDIIEHLKPFEKSSDEFLPDIAVKSALQAGIKPIVSSFHAGAETHIFANENNKYGQQFKPCLIGVANVFNMHSCDEKIDIDSFCKGYEFLKNIFVNYNQSTVA